MTKRHTPPTRRSNALVVVEKPSGPHHFARCWGSVHTAKTRSRGASSTRVPIMAGGSSASSKLFFPDTRLLLPRPCLFLLLLLLLRLQLAQIIFEAIEALFPKAAVAFEPVVDALERLGLDAAGAPLRLAAARDQPGALQHLEVLGDRRKAHVEGFGQLGDRRLAQRQPSQDRPAGRIGKGRKRGAQGVGHDEWNRSV